MTKVKCLICDKELELINNLHLRIHKITVEEYREIYPDALLSSDEYRESKREYSKNNNPMSKKEHKETLSKAKTGVRRPDIEGDANPAKESKVRQKISNALCGREFTEEWIEKLKQHKKTKKHRENLSKAKVGKSISFSREDLKRRSDMMKGESNPMKNPTIKEIHRKKQAATHRQLWQDPEFVRKMFTAWNVKPNKPEKILNGILQHILPNEYTLNVEGHIIIDGKIPDFVNVNGQKKLIEFNGCFFHHCPICFPDSGVVGLKEAENRIKLFKKYGWETLVIWGHEMENIDVVTNKILKFNNTSHHK